MAHCFPLEVQSVLRAFALAFERAGRSMPARIAMMAITTSNSIRVNAVGFRKLDEEFMAGESAMQAFIRRPLPAAITL